MLCSDFQDKKEKKRLKPGFKSIERILYKNIHVMDERNDVTTRGGGEVTFHVQIREERSPEKDHCQ